MFKAIKENKIIAISEQKYIEQEVEEKTIQITVSPEEHFPCLVYDEVVEDKEHTTADYDQYEGEYLLKSEIPLPTNDEQSAKRAEAYAQEVDPITAHISRLKDEEQTEEIVADIEELKAERSAKVQEIKERFPYYENKEQEPLTQE